jgi:hypothetical protein
VDGRNGSRAGQRETDEQRAERVLLERARALAAPAGADEEERTVPVVGFDAGPERYGVTLEAVLRIERVGAVARVPGAGPGIVGVLSVDGRPCPLLEVPALLGASAAAPGGARRWAIVLGRRAPELALAADAVDLVRVRGDLGGGEPPRLGTTPDARVVLDGTALLSRSGGTEAKRDA